ncbi:MAG: HD family hydrolase [Pseudomonadota bacterium]
MPSSPKSTRTPAPRAWQRMLSGRRLDILDPSPLDVEIEDIAHGLARVARWNGQTTGPLPFNVAQHSVIVEDICSTMKPGWPVQWRLAALLHDAPEFVIGDMISPFKAALGPEYKNIEHGLQRAIHIRFGIAPELPETVEKIIKTADRTCAFLEAVQLAGFDAIEARKLFTPPASLTARTLVPQTSEAAEASYLARFAALNGMM